MNFSSFSSTTIGWICRLVRISLRIVLSITVWILLCTGKHRNIHRANAFRVSPRLSVPRGNKGTITTTAATIGTCSSRAEQVHIRIRETERKSSSRVLSSSCKYDYDLGLGKNAPVVRVVPSEGNDNSNRRQQGLQNGTSTAAGLATTYEAIRFLVEHEATRTYPAPSSCEDDIVLLASQEQKSRVDRTFSTIVTRKATSKLAISTTATTIPNEQKGTNERERSEPPPEKKMFEY